MQVTVLAALLVRYGRNELSARWLVFVGDVSYVLYLVHWPVIVFVKYSSFGNLSTSGE